MKKRLPSVVKFYAKYLILHLINQKWNLRWSSRPKVIFKKDILKY